MAHLNLRQICLAAPALAPVEAAIEHVFGLEVCHRDPAVGKYGLVNSLFVFGRQFVEIVAPSRTGTAVERFLARSGGRGAYMAIFDCSDPERRADLARALGVRIAHELAHPGYRGIQLHPRDCRATMLEFDCTDGGDDLDGPYHPAGEHWRRAQRLDRVSGIASFDVESPEADDLARHWSRLVDRPVRGDGIAFDLGRARFVAAPAGTPERLSTLHVTVADADAVLAAARAHGLAGDATGFDIGGVRFEPHAG